MLFSFFDSSFLSEWAWIKKKTKQKKKILKNTKKCTPSRCIYYYDMWDKKNIVITPQDDFPPCSTKKKINDPFDKKNIKIQWLKCKQSPKIVVWFEESQILQKFEHAKSENKNEILNPQNCSKMIIQTILKVQKKRTFSTLKIYNFERIVHIWCTVRPLLSWLTFLYLYIPWHFFGSFQFSTYL